MNRNYLRETGYVLKKLGVDFHDVSVARLAQSPVTTTRSN